MKGALRQLCRLSEDPRAFVAMLAWPKFSMSAYSLVTKIARQGLAPGTIIDVGANVGQFAIAAARTFPGARIRSFEPHPDCVEQFKRNTRKLANVSISPLALGDRRGTTDFHLNTLSYSSSILPLADAHRDAFPQAQETRCVSVPMSTLDDELGDIDLAPPVLLKLDVQGYEAPVLHGAARALARVDHVLLETSFKPMYEGEAVFMDVARLMDAAGFEFLRPVDWLADPRTGEILQADVLFAPRRRG
jgi:FkbM family methyltransferase